MKFRTDRSSEYLTPFRYRSGCWCWFLRRMFRKNGEQAERMTLWAEICSSFSHARVTSKKSLSSRISRNAVLMFASKSFHFKQNFSLDILNFYANTIGWNYWMTSQFFMESFINAWWELSLIIGWRTINWIFFCLFIASENWLKML